MRALTGAIMIVASAPVSVPAQEEGVTEHVSVALDAGFFEDYDDSGMWEKGLGGGVTGLWALNATTSLCARFSVTHWSYEPASVVPELIPAGAEVVLESSTGQLQIVSLTPLLRYQRERVIGSLGAFVAGGPGIAYVKRSALTELTYSFGGPTGFADFEIDESDFDAAVEAMTGLSHAVSSSSWLDLMASYRAVFASETANVFGVQIAFRLRV